MTGRCLAAALCLSLSATAAAEPYPIVREGAEVEVPLAPAALSVGRWQAGPDGLGLVEPDGARAYWLVPGQVGSFVRLRLAPAKGVDAALLFRVTLAPGSAAGFTGYGLSLDTRRGRADFLRWDEGAVRDPGMAQSLPALKGRAELEVCLWLAGPNFVATIHDGKSKQLLGTLAWSDDAYPSGALGLYANERSERAARARLFVPTAERPAAKPAPAPVPALPPPAKLPEGATGRAWLSAEWLATVDPAAYEASGLHATGRFTKLAREAGGLVLFTDELGVALLTERGLEPKQARPGVPFRYRPAFTRLSPQTPLAPGLRDLPGLERALDALATKAGSRATLETIGTSAEGRPIRALRLRSSDERPRPAVLVTAGLHAAEGVATAYAIDAAVDWLSPAREALRARFELWLVPALNPDGLHAFFETSDRLGRKNRRLAAPVRNAWESGVDLNRNFATAFGTVTDRYNADAPGSPFYRGPGPLSEPEAQALDALAGRERFLAAVSFHGAAGRLLVPYTAEALLPPAPDVAWELARLLAPSLRPVGRTRWEVVQRLYPVSGTEQDHLAHAHGALAWLLEVPSTFPESREKLEAELASSREFLPALLERWLRGPSLALIVRDASTGAPIAATIELAEIERRAGERLQSRARDGAFFTFLPGRGPWTVIATLEGRRAELRLPATAKLHEAELRL